MMKLNWLACGVIGGVLFLVSSCWGEENVTVLEVETKAGLRMQVEVYPREIQLGDTLYFGVTVQNTTEKDMALTTIRQDDGISATCDDWVAVDGLPVWNTSLYRMASCRTFYDFWKYHLACYKYVSTIEKAPGAN